MHRWPVSALRSSARARVAVNAVRGGGAVTVAAVRDAGRMATITGDPPEGGRGISISDVYVRPDTAQLEELCALLGNGQLSLAVGACLPPAEAATALERVVKGASGGPVVLSS